MGKFNFIETEIKDVDALILAVAHDSFKTMKMSDFESFFKGTDNCRKVMIDVKGLLDRKAFEDAGYNYWRL